MCDFSARCQFYKRNKIPSVFFVCWHLLPHGAPTTVAAVQVFLTELFGLPSDNYNYTSSSHTNLCYKFVLPWHFRAPNDYTHMSAILKLISNFAGHLLHRSIRQDFMCAIGTPPLRQGEHFLDTTNTGSTHRADLSNEFPELTQTLTHGAYDCSPFLYAMRVIISVRGTLSTCSWSFFAGS